MNYPESVRFLYALGNEIKTAKLGLDRIRTVLDALGNPQRSGRFIHVAGTNGKGSTSAMIEAGLRWGGELTGLYTSPHLDQPTERIQIGGVPVSAGQFAQAFEAVHRTSEELLRSGTIDFHPTYFETVTAMAFVLFRELEVQRVVLEVGLGGRLDATNVVQPELCVITPIDFDHEQFLGNTIESIAREKAGILKRGVASIFAKQRPEAQTVLVECAQRLGCEYREATDAHVSQIRMDARGSRFVMDGQEVICSLAGEHQVENAIVAAMALKQLGIPLDGIGRTAWPGRLERVAESPEIILDGAHNPAGARALAAYIQSFYSGRRIWMVYGSMRDKAVDEITGILFPLASGIVVTAPRFGRALRPEAIQAMWPAQVRATETLEQAIAIIRAESRPTDVIFITGSLFVVGEARSLLVQ